MPSVAVHTHVFARVAKSTARLRGIPTLRQAFVPQPVVGRTPPELRAYIEGSDQVSGRPFMQEVIDGLTRPLDDADLTGATFARTTPRLVAPDTEENLRQLFLDNRWTDFLPIVLPTEERVAAMLKATSQPPDKVVGRMRTGNFRETWEYTVEKVAVNAVMAGARPEYFPVILALAASNTTSRQGSTTSMTCLSVVNGPVRHQIGMNAGIGALGPYSHANTTIGRAYSLLSQNGQGGSVPGETYMGALGNPLAYSLAFAENEERSPWQPLHVPEGFQANRQHRERVRRPALCPGRIWPARYLGGKIPALPRRDGVSAAARGARSDRGAAVPIARHQFEAGSDRLVRGQRPPAGARLLGRSVDADAGATARRRGRRALCDKAQGRAR